MKHLQRYFWVVFLSLVVSTSARCEIVVIVSENAGITQLTQDEVINIFLGRYLKLPSGQAARPYDLPVADRLRADFYRKLVDKNLAEINAYWTRLYFSGKANPPEVSPTPQDVLNTVVTVPGAIGYLQRSQVDDRVRAVFSLEK